MCDLDGEGISPWIKEGGCLGFRQTHLDDNISYCLGSKRVDV